MQRVAWAQELAERLLAVSLPRRWSHVQGVGRRAEAIAHVVGDDDVTLICAAWLHDIGYAPPLAKTGLHALDGARYLRDAARAENRLCRLIAHHSGAIFEARNRGLADDLMIEFPPVEGIAADGLTFCDMTTSPDGGLIDAESRLDEIISRYGEDDIVATSIREARPYIRQSVQTIASRLGE